MGKLMIYGATGYTDALISEQARISGIDTVLGGRTRNSLQSAAAALNVPSRLFSLDNPDVVDSNLDGIEVVLNCAGPFARTAKPLIEACIRTETHYLDTSAELDTYLLAEQNDSAAKAASVMLLPGCGGSVATLGCLVGRALQSLDNVQSVDLALHVSGPMSRGSAITAQEGSSAPCLNRCDGSLVTQETTDTADFDFADGRGPVLCFPVTLPDLITIHKFFGVKNIRTFANASGGAFPEGELDNLPDGPTPEQRNANPYHAAVVVTTTDGKVEPDALRLVNGYTLIATASVEAARRVMAGEVLPGFRHLQSFLVPSSSPHVASEGDHPSRV